MRIFLSLLAVGLATASGAHAQRASENAVTQAEDAFGLSVGNERLGLYAEDNVRGFSPSAAGNVRLEGLYFDRIAVLSPRLARGSTVRVGLSAQGYDFPAPSGIVDYALRLPNGAQLVSTVLSADSWGRGSVEIDSDLKIAETVALGAGASYVREGLAYGGSRNVLSGTMMLRVRLRPSFQIVPYFSVSKVTSEEAQPRIFTGGEFLPPPVQPRRFYGQPWTEIGTLAQNYGVLAEGQLTERTTVKAGLFRSQAVVSHGFFDFFLQTDPNGRADHVVAALPDQRYASTSGELRLTHSFDEGPRRHAVLISLRGRDRLTVFGGAKPISLGPAIVGQPEPVSEPPFTLGVASSDAVRQRTLGVGYQGLWREVGELNVGLQRSNYERNLHPAVGPAAVSSEGFWLWNVNSAAYVRRWLTLFGGYTRGLEDGGTAPANAVNANAALPATPTRQGDLGLRAAVGPMRFVGAVFQIEKPYYTLDRTGLFAPIGQIRSRGAEFSLIASPADGLKLVAGLVFTRPRVTDPGRSTAFQPIGTTQTTARLSADYSPPRAPALSFDGAIGYSGSRAAALDDHLFIPSRTTLDLGVRYRFRVAGNRSTLRLAVYNVMDAFTWAVDQGGGFTPESPRRFVASLYTDF